MELPLLMYYFELTVTFALSGIFTDVICASYGTSNSLSQPHSLVKRYFAPQLTNNNKGGQPQPPIDNVLERFHTNTNTIIRTHDSRELGAKYLNETVLPSNEDCIYWCWQTSPCNLAVYEEKNRGSCYLFDCGSSDDFRCKFTPHNQFTSSILQVNRHSYDLSLWGSQVRHENELAKLRSPFVASTTVNPLFVSGISSTSTTQTLIPPPAFLPSTNPPIKISRCQHYQYECRNSSECIAIYNVCDGIPQCPDGSDEAPDLECQKSRYKADVVQPQQNSGAKFSPDMTKLPGKAQQPPQINRPQNPLPSRDKMPQQSGGPSAYSYPKAPDDGPNAKPDDTSPFNRKYSGFLPATDFANNKGFNNPYGRTSWNQYYQPDTYNNNDNRPNNGYVVEPEYPNGYSRDPNSNTSPYWTANGRQQTYDLSDQLLQQAQPLLTASRVQQMGTDDWRQSSDLAAAGYYERQNGALRDASTKPGSQLRPVSQETAAVARPKVNKSPTSPEVKTQNTKSQDSNLQKTDQQSKPQAAAKPKTQASNPIYSNLAASKGISRDANVAAVSYMHDSNQQNGRETNSAVIALILGLCITALLIFLVGCRMKSIKRKIARRGRSLTHDADYLVNGMYL